MLNLWDDRHRVNKHKPIKTAEITMNISKICYVKFKFRIKDTYRIVIPFHVDRKIEQIKKLIQNTLVNSGINHILAKYSS